MAKASISTAAAATLFSRTTKMKLPSPKAAPACIFHGGGSDLIFPHHENEIAQSEGCTGVHPFVRYWLHNGFITVNEEKMSKSLGNFFTVADILEHFEPETLRFFILSTHYRSPLLKEAQRSLARLKTAQDNLKELAQLISGGPTETSKALYAKLEELRSGFMEAMSDDFNTALAISFMFELAKEINIYHQHISTGSEKPDGKLVENMEKLFAEFCGIIGVLETSAQPAAEKDASLEDKLIETVVSLRQEARAAKNYAQADALRNALTGLGIVLEDTPQGVRWKKYKLVKEHALAAVQAAGVSLPEAGSMNPVLLAYVGDVVFSLYVRLRFLAASSHVRVIHDLSSKAVSAVYQAKALAALMDTLNEQELAVVKRGRNTKSSVPKTASVHEYRMSTAFEALIGWLFLNNADERLGTIMEQAFNIIIDDFKTK